MSRTLNILDPASAFAPLQPLHDTDIEGFTKHAHEQTIISAIEEGRRATVDNFYKTLEMNMRKDWERQKELVFEELGRHSANAVASTSTSALSRTGGRRSTGGREPGFGDVSAPVSLPHTAGSQLQMHSRMMRYDTATRKLNEYRKQGFAVGIISAYGEAGASGAGSNDSVRGNVIRPSGRAGLTSLPDIQRATQLAETWSLLAHLVREHDVVNGEFQREALQERQYASDYLSENQDSPQAKDLRKMFTGGALAHLEEQCVSLVSMPIEYH